MRHVALMAMLSHWRRQPMQLTTLILGLALATGLWSAVQALNGQARSSYARAATQLEARALAQLTPATGEIGIDRYVALRRAGWLVSPELEGKLRLGSRQITLLGVDFMSHPISPDIETGQADLQPSDVLLPPGRLFAHPATIAEIGPGETPVPLVASNPLPLGIVLTDIGTAEALLGRPGRISRLLVLPDQPRDLPPLSELAPDLILSPPQQQADMSRLTASFHLNLTAFGLLAFAVGLFIVHGAIGLAFEQRRAMFRTLRALGVPLTLLARLLLVELGGLALISGGLGLVLGYLVAAALLPDVSATLRGLYGAPVIGTLSLRPLWFASGLAMALLGALIAGAQAIRKLHHLPLLAAPGQQGWLGAARAGMPVMAALGAGLIAAGGLALLFLDGLLAGFALVAGVMMGSALFLPPILTVLIERIARRPGSVIATWFWADLRSQLPGLSLALMALLLAMATNIGVGTMVSSFRLTFTGWLDQRLAAELYVTARSDAEAEQLTAWLRPRSQAVLPVRYVRSHVLGQPVRIRGIIDHATYRDHWPLIRANTDVWERLHDGTGALINEQFARRHSLWPGAALPLGPGQTKQVVGVYSDYGNPNGQIIVALPALMDQFAGERPRQFEIRLPPDDAARLADTLRQTFDLPARAVLNQATIKARSLEIFEKTFVVTAALNLLTLGVAGFAMLTSLLTLWTLRLPQLAPVWALGMTRRHLAWLDLLRSTALAALTAILALPLGLFLAWALLSVINVEAFGWRLPIHAFPLDWLRLILLATLAAALAAALPARRLRRTPPSEFLKIFSHEK